MPSPADKHDDATKLAVILSAACRQEALLIEVLQKLAGYKADLNVDRQRIFDSIERSSQLMEQFVANIQVGCTIEKRSSASQNDSTNWQLQQNAMLDCSAPPSQAEMNVPQIETTPTSRTQSESPSKKFGGHEETPRNALKSFCVQASFRVYEREASIVSYWVRVVRQFITSTSFELTMMVIIMLNLIFLAIQTQLQGLHAYQRSGLAAGDVATHFESGERRSGWSDWIPVFDVTEYIFNAIYMLELAFRVAAFGKKFFKNTFNLLDACVIVVNCVESIQRSVAHHRNTTFKLSILRVFRALRVFRFAKLVRYMSSQLTEVQLLVRTLLVSFYGMAWCVIVIGILIAAAALFKAQICIDFLDDEALEVELRRWLFESFGTFTRGFFTMFEATFTTHWWYYARVMTKERWTFHLFWIPFVICINFATMRVVSALFLKQTLALAEIDKERAAMDKMKQKEHFAKEIKGVFREADISRDGLLSKQEWDAMLHKSKVIEHFRAMDMTIDEVDAVFQVCSSDDDVVDFDEFLNSAMKMKGSARTIDMIQIMHNQLAMSRQLTELSNMLRNAGCQSGLIQSLPLGNC